ncbi:MAG: Hypothetical protein BHV28_07150 [Candidatus Tokpelaia hoelldobleri]|uniref:Uncharacterized protein n=1 Tax=Candidatus Tokpelaia hoelldobleri TaxID=1902579 RepID=A0A1U9JU77_9HYPH|nr:MAG: Hypothetical protein BHV28_07150 [Candidatus Tokpelaia hoelldoblerii]
MQEAVSSNSTLLSKFHPSITEIANNLIAIHYTLAVFRDNLTHTHQHHPHLIVLADATGRLEKQLESLSLFVKAPDNRASATDRKRYIKQIREQTLIHLLKQGFLPEEICKATSNPLAFLHRLQQELAKQAN